jgi:hypothetical protein
VGLAQVLVSGSLTVSPPTVVGTVLSSSPLGTVPAGVSQVPLVLSMSPKQSAVNTGLRHKALNSPSSFVTLSGLGASDDVTTADTLYLKSDSAIQIRLTMQDPAGGSPIVSIETLIGLKVQEFPQAGYLTLLEAMGIANLELMISGPA